MLSSGEAEGKLKATQAFVGQLSDSYELKLRTFFGELKTAIPASFYGTREAWLLGEDGTAGDYDFSTSNCQGTRTTRGYGNLA